MLLSELMQAPQTDPLVFGLEVDTDMFSPPSGLFQAGLVYAGSPHDPDTNFLDAVMACGLAGIDTIAEIEPHQAIDPAAMLDIAGNAGYSLAILPPHSEGGLDAWCAHCAAFATAFLDTPHFSGHLYPVSGYFGHLVAQSVSGVQGHSPQDPYTRQRFVDAIPTEWADRAKAAMKKAWEDRVGGPAALDALLKNIAGAAVIETMDLLDRLTDAGPDGTPTP